MAVHGAAETRVAVRILHAARALPAVASVEIQVVTAPLVTQAAAVASAVAAPVEDAALAVAQAAVAAVVSEAEDNFSNAQ